MESGEKAGEGGNQGVDQGGDQGGDRGTRSCNQGGVKRGGQAHHPQTDLLRVGGQHGGQVLGTKAG